MRLRQLVHRVQVFLDEAGDEDRVGAGKRGGLEQRSKSGCEQKPHRDRIMPNILDKAVTKAVAKAVEEAAVACGCSRHL